MDVPADLRYSSDHEWVRLAGSIARVGITDYAQDALGDVVYVEIPSVGSAVSAGQRFGEVESTKSVSEVYSPVSGEVVGVNAATESTTPTTAARTRLLGTRFIDRQCTAAHFGAVERRNGRLGFRIRRHFHKAKSSGLAGKFIRDDPCGRHGAVGCKQITQLLLGRRIGQPTDINL